MDGVPISLIERLQRGEADALAELYALFHVRLYSYLRRMARSAALADDLFQETWMKVAKSATRLHDHSKLEAWLFTVARNTYLSHRRWFRVQDRHASAATPSATSTEDLGLLRALDELPRDERELLLLIADSELSLEAVAEVMNISYAALRKRLSRARGKLAVALRHEGVRTP